MNLITIYELGKAQHQEIEAEFVQYCGAYTGQPKDLPASYRFIMGLGSIVLSAIIILQMLIG